MQNPRDNGGGVSARERLDALHAQIVGCKAIDTIFSAPVSNRDKVDFICSAVKAQVETFDLCTDWPIKDWLASGDQSLLRCGLYLTDMRRKFFDLIMAGNEKGAAHELWEMHAEAEYSFYEFNAMIYRRSKGDLLPEHRVLN